MAPRKRSAAPAPESGTPAGVETPPAPEAHPTDPTPSSRAQTHRRRGPGLLALIGRPVVHLPLLVLVGVLAGYIAGAVRLSARERDWDRARAQLEEQARGLESSLQIARQQETYYRVLVSVSRVVVHLFDRNFGLAAEELRAARESIEQVSAASGTSISATLDAFQADMDELARQVDEASRTARETMRAIEHDVTRALFPDEP